MTQQNEQKPAALDWLHWVGSIKTADADTIISGLESMGLGWSLDHTGSMFEARIWKWPNVIGRHRNYTEDVEPLADMLRAAIDDVEILERSGE